MRNSSDMVTPSQIITKAIQMNPTSYFPSISYL
uniref:Uncharacterized protein n=1 Tax=Rhizophora mucronata TaxID=61149 RepID=A0A2P2NCK3_RHIMU